jgi:hypothetical protein
MLIRLQVLLRALGDHLQDLHLSLPKMERRREHFG